MITEFGYLTGEIDHCAQDGELQNTVCSLPDHLFPKRDLCRKTIIDLVVCSR